MKFQRLALFVVSLLVSVSAFAQVNDTYIIPAAANDAGKNNSRWATEFHIFNPQPHPLRVTLAFLRTGGLQGPDPVKFTVDPNSTAYAKNILKDVFNWSGTGSLLIATFASDNPAIPNNVISRSFLVNSNTYNDSSSGTFGQAIPGTFYGLMDYEFDEISGIAHGITNSSSQFTGFRTNIGAVNLGDRNVTLLVRVYDSEGAQIGNELPFSLPPQAHAQSALPVVVEHGSVEFFVDDPSQQSVVFPYASIIDNRTGDPVYVNPVLLATPGALLTGQKVAPQPRKLTSSDAARIIGDVNAARAIELKSVKGRLSATVSDE